VISNVVAILHELQRRYTAFGHIMGMIALSIILLLGPTRFMANTPAMSCSPVARPFENDRQ
jgi:hypothetical protein